MVEDAAPKSKPPIVLTVAAMGADTQWPGVLHQLLAILSLHDSPKVPPKV